MDVEDQKLMLKQIGKFVRDEIKKAVEPLRARIAELETRGVEYKGTFQRACSYSRGDLVTHSGRLWCAVAETKPLQIPGECAAWVLAVKSSGNGKDHDAQRRLPTQGGARPQTTVTERRP
jgi:hypothetical protein